MSTIMPDDVPPLRVGAVNYLNTKPLVHGLERISRRLRLTFDLPSRLADQLACGVVDAALVPVVEMFRHPDYVRVSDACIACRGPVRSVKLYFRTPPSQVRRLALDEGSRTSVVLARILLAELAGVRPQIEPLPIGQGLVATEADAVLLIGDRAMYPQPGDFAEVWDLGQRWTAWTGLPFVFAVWAVAVGSAGSGDPRRALAQGDSRRARDSRRVREINHLADALAAARDAGIAHLAEIAAREAQEMNLDTATCLEYLRDNLHFRLGPEELAGLARFEQLARAHGLVAQVAERSLHVCAIG